ncbi:MULTISPECIES: triose-phosphate isomerase [unclassified Actinomyces]|uniref:triose-phosphate isomerase n=1 Tax=unclassified Actinomyces TaxID=2609248 RepID=UPI00135C17A5|nr:MULTISPECIES: triose-phosphate isomerase [unclassified Actinomyces]
MSNRTPLMAGNWKMNLDHLEANHLVQGLAMELKDAGHDFAKCEAVVIPPFTDLRTVQTVVDADDLEIKYGAQDVSIHDNGAYTGEISTAMLTKLGCSYVVMGHSERREYHNESDELVGAKARKALDAGMTPILCCGEALEIRKAGTHVEFVLGQIRAALKGWSAEDVARIVIAYEPIWAIGTGETATAADAQEVCGAIRAALREDFGEATAEATRVLYGGSAKPDNIVELMAQPDIDGALIGGASLKADSFAAMCRFYAA